MLARVFCLCFLAAVFHPCEGGSFTTLQFLSSCSGGALVLPNLSFAKIVIQGPLPVPPPVCDPNPANSTVLAVFTQVITWYYYATYPPICGANPADECCHSTATSTLTFTISVSSSSDLGSVTTSTGTVTAGPFLGAVVTATGTRLVENGALCTTPMGREARSGTRTVTILGGPTCAGVVAEEYCPGLRN